MSCKKCSWGWGQGHIPEAEALAQDAPDYPYRPPVERLGITITATSVTRARS